MSSSKTQPTIDSHASQTSSGKFAEVAVPVPIDRTLTYRVDEETGPRVTPGCRVVVPLGKKLVTGYVVAVNDKPDTSDSVEIKSVKQILDAEPVCTPEVLAVTKWVSEYYASAWGEVIKAALPPGISPAIAEFFELTPKGLAEVTAIDHDSPKGQLLSALASNDRVAKEELLSTINSRHTSRLLNILESDGLVVSTHISSAHYTRAKVRKFVRLNEDESLDKTTLSKAATRVMSALQPGPATLQSLLKAAHASSSTISSLEKKGFVVTYDAEVRRDPFSSADDQAVEYLLTAGQRQVLNRIDAQLKTHSFGAILLHGVTGSGKTEVYIQAMRSALALGKTAMMLVPEIALTPVFSRRLRANFGDQVAIFHSSLQKGERYDEWTRVRNGEASIVIGTRSAVFAPISNLGLIVVDEEHEPSYRQQDYPFYNGRDTAIVRAQQSSATVVLGSATPSLESFQNARSGKYEYLSLPERIGSRPMAKATLIDMREVFDRHGQTRVFSDELLQAIRETHDRGEQSIMLLNRRGYSRFVICRSCGESLQCPNCDVTLTFHRADRAMVCHYCNHRQPPPSTCPACGKQYIFYVGEGTEQLEEMLNKLFPELQIARIDRDTTARRKRFEKSLLDFSTGKVDMLVGTQMLAKGHDFPNVTLVGVISVDAGLALPDFRAAERTFQLITQVAGRAGRGERPGRVLIQTFHPDHYALRHACAQNYDSFYAEEIKYRRNHSYPPFVALASLLVHGPDISRVRANALDLKSELERENADRSVRILGPAPAPLARLKAEHRFQLLLKAPSRKRIRQLADAALKAMAQKGVNLKTINLEIDPVSLM